jgi:hypothetical protein
MNDPAISLGRLACACHLYDAMTDYGRSWRSFRDTVHDKLDLTDRGHRSALLQWLNAWTCRIDLDYLDSFAEGLAGWFDRYRVELPGAEDSLFGLSETALEAFLDPFDQLSAIKPPGARRRFGPTAASKALFALCPTVFVPWDNAIREELVRGASGAAYVRFLKRMRDDLQTIAVECVNKGFDLNRLAEKLYPPRSSPAQLVGEYYWVKITRRVQLPDAGMLRTWAAWS